MINENVRLTSVEVPALFMRKERFSEKSCAVALHHHNETELLYIREGEFPCTVDGESFVLHGGEMLFINSRVSHSTVPERAKYDMIQINTESLFFGSVPHPIFALIAHGGKPFHRFGKSDSEKLAALFDGVFFALSEKSSGKNQYLLGALYMICARLIALGLISNPDELAESKTLGKLSAALSHISANYTLNITTPELAKMCNLNTAYFCELFKTATGKTAVEFINALRIRRAEELIATTNMSMTEIALSLGFSSSSYFDRVFKKVNGNSPREFRALSLREI